MRHFLKQQPHQTRIPAKLDINDTIREAGVSREDYDRGTDVGNSLNLSLSKRRGLPAVDVSEGEPVAQAPLTLFSSHDRTNNVCRA